MLSRKTGSIAAERPRVNTMSRREMRALCHVCGRWFDAKDMHKISLEHNGESTQWAGVCKFCGGEVDNEII